MMLTLKLEATAGSQLDHVALRMQRLADMLGVDVEVPFNDVKLIAVPGGKAGWLADNFHSEIKRELFPLRPKMAFSHHEPEPQVNAG